MHSIPEWLRLAETSGDHLVYPPAQAESPRAGYQESCPVEFWVSPGMETSQLLWANFSIVWLPSKKCFLMFRWNFMYLSWCLLFLVFPPNTTEKSLASSSLLCPHTRYLYTLIRPLKPSLLRAEQPQLYHPQTPHMKDVPMPWPLSWLFAVFVSKSLYLSCTGKTGTGQSTLDVSHQRWVEVKPDHLAQPAVNALHNAAHSVGSCFCYKEDFWLIFLADHQVSGIICHLTFN